MTAIRNRLPNRRPNQTGHITACGMTMAVTAGFDPDTGAVAEVFVGGHKGSALDAIMADIAVVVSVALQHGLPIEALAHSIARVPAAPMRPEDLDGRPLPTIPASPVGAMLDWIGAIERGEA